MRERENRGRGRGERGHTLLEGMPEGEVSDSG